MNWFRLHSNTDRDYFTTACYVVMLFAFVGGMYFRLKGLGKSPFAVDEYYIATSVRNILEHGLPQYDCGGFYVRGLLLQYLVVPFFKYGSNDEFYFRLITVIFNLLTVPGLYLLAKQVSGRTAACFVVTLFCLSIWEIEFARFARMYSPFQMLFVWYVFFLYRAIILDDSVANKWMYLISFLSIFIYEGAIFLVLMNFLPFVVTGKKMSAWGYVPSALIVIFAYAFVTIDFRHLGVESHLPADLDSQAAGGPSLPIELPMLLITTLKFDLAWLLTFLIPLGLSAIAVWQLFSEHPPTEKVKLTRVQATLFSLFIILSLFNQYGLVIYLLVLAWLLDWVNLRHIRTNSLRLMFIAIGVTFVFWSCYGIFTDSWYVLLQTTRTSPAEDLLKSLLIVLFKYPDTYAKILVPWFSAMPVLTIATTLLVLFGLSESAIKRHDEGKGYVLLITILLGLSLIVAALKQPYYETRYTFFLYPVLLLVVTVSLQRLAHLIARDGKAYRISLTGLVMAFMLLSEDFGIEHAWKIDSQNTLYRMAYDRARQTQYYPRRDVWTPAKFVNDNMKVGDIVVNMTKAVPYYLRQIDYVYVNHKSRRFRGIVGCGGKKELWSNTNLIYKRNELFELLQNAESTIWLIVYSKPLGEHSEAGKRIQDLFTRNRVFQSVDGRIEVYKITPKQDRQLGTPAS